MGSLDIPLSKKIPAELKDPGAQPPARQGHGEDRQSVPIWPGPDRTITIVWYRRPQKSSGRTGYRTGYGAVARKWKINEFSELDSRLDSDPSLTSRDLR